MSVKIESFDGEGLKRAVESGAWFVGIKNWKPANDAALFNCLERHMESDEVFVLLTGACTLLIGNSIGQTFDDIQCVSMEQGKVYSIPKGVWHNTITSRDAKLILVENIDTSSQNSEIYDLNDQEIAGIRMELG